MNVQYIHVRCCNISVWDTVVHPCGMLRHIHVGRCNTFMRNPVVHGKCWQIKYHSKQTYGQFNKTMCMTLWYRHAVVHESGMSRYKHTKHYSTHVELLQNIRCHTCNRIDHCGCEYCWGNKPNTNTIQGQNNAKEQCCTKFNYIVHVRNVCSHILQALLSTVHSFTSQTIA